MKKIKSYPPDVINYRRAEQLYKKLSTQARRQINKAKYDHVTGLFSQTSTQAEFWQAFRKLSGKRDGVPHLADLYESISTFSIEKANRIADLFTVDQHHSPCTPTLSMPTPFPSCERA